MNPPPDPEDTHEADELRRADAAARRLHAALVQHPDPRDPDHPDDDEDDAA